MNPLAPIKVLFLTIFISSFLAFEFLLVKLQRSPPPGCSFSFFFVLLLEIAPLFVASTFLRCINRLQKVSWTPDHPSPLPCFLRTSHRYCFSSPIRTSQPEAHLYDLSVQTISLGEMPLQESSLFSGRLPI